MFFFFFFIVVVLPLLWWIKIYISIHRRLTQAGYPSSRRRARCRITVSYSHRPRRCSSVALGCLPGHNSRPESRDESLSAPWVVQVVIKRNDWLFITSLNDVRIHAVTENDNVRSAAHGNGSSSSGLRQNGPHVRRISSSTGAQHASHPHEENYSSPQSSSAQPAFHSRWITGLLVDDAEPRWASQSMLPTTRQEYKGPHEYLDIIEWRCQDDKWRHYHWIMWTSNIGIKHSLDYHRLVCLCV